jgi:outer membrane receptor for ferrienterochelin and colicin
MKSFVPARTIFLTISIITANQGLAQETSEEEADIEEVVVTGSFIRNSQFTNASPVVSISTDDIWQSGAANLGEYIRDLPYMENIDNPDLDGWQAHRECGRSFKFAAQHCTTAR